MNKYLFPSDVFFMVRNSIRKSDIKDICLEVEEELNIRLDDSDLVGKSVSVDEFIEFMEGISKKINDPYLALRLGKELIHHFHGHILFALIQNCLDLEMALDYFAKYHNLVHGDQFNIAISKEKGELIFPIMYWEDFRGREHLHEVYLFGASIVAFIQHLSSDEVTPCKARFVFPRPADTTLLEQCFGHHIEYGQSCNEIYFTRQDLKRKLPFSNVKLMHVLETQVKELVRDQRNHKSWQTRTAECLATLVFTGQTSIETVSAEMNVGVRTLQNRLQMENTSFREVWNQVRMDIATHYLANTSEPFVNIALLLGFSDQGAFTKSFKNWTGKTPGVYRQQKQSQNLSPV